MFGRFAGASAANAGTMPAKGRTPPKADGKAACGNSYGGTIVHGFILLTVDSAGINVDNADIDCLATGRLMAMHREQVLAGLKHRRVVNRKCYIVGFVSRNAGHIHTIDEHFGVFVVINTELQIVVLRVGNRDFAAEPNIGRVPRGIDMGSRSAGGAESAFASLSTKCRRNRV